MANQRRSGVLLGYLNISVRNLVYLLYTPLLLRYLGQNDYGVFQMVNSAVMFLSILSAGFNTAYIRFYSRREAAHDQDGIRQLNTVYIVTYICISVVSLILGLLLALNVQSIFSRGLTKPERDLAFSLVIIMTVNISCSFINAPFDAYIAAHEQFVFQQSRQIVTTLLQPLIAWFLLENNFGAYGVASSQVMMTVVLLILNVRFACHKLHMRFDFKRFNLSLFKAIAIFSFWIFLNQVTDLVNNQVPDFLLGVFISSSAVAVFSVAVQIRTVFVSLSTTMLSVFVPLINKIAAVDEDNNKLLLLMTKIGRYQTTLFCFIFGGFVVLGKYFIHIWAGDANADAYWLSLIMILPVGIDLVQNTGIEIQRARNKQKARSLILITTAALDVAVSALLIPRIGYWAAAIGYVISMVLGYGILMNLYYHFNMKLNMKYFWAKQSPTIVLTLVITLIFSVLTFFMPIDNFALFISVGLLYCAVFGCASWFFILHLSERQRISSWLSDKVHRLRRN